MKSGAELLCDTLERLGVRCVFGLPGTQNLALYEALRRSRLRSVVATHELAASFMANGYYRASGRLAPLLTIPGPGFTYALTGLAEARQDSAALLHVVGAPPEGRRPFQFQALDQRALASPLAKAVLRAEEPGEVERGVSEAVALALSGEPGPVVLEWTARALEEGACAAPSPPGPAAPDRAAPADPASLEAAASLLADARRPVLLVGQGSAGSAARVRELAQLLGAAVLSTLSGRGIVPEDDPLSLGYDFTMGHVDELNALLAASDCVLVLGCKLSAAGTDNFALALPLDRLIQIDAAGPVVGATYPGRLGVVGALEVVLEELLPAVRRRRDAATGGWTPEALADWRRRLHAPHDAVRTEPRVHGIEPATPEAFFASLRRALPPEAILVADSGLHQTLARRHFRVLAPRGLLTPSDYQSMGFGLPAAIGAKLAAPERPVVALIGDGGFAMSGMELMTALRERIALTVIVFNDGQLNRIRLQQLAEFGRSEGCEVLNPDFGAFADAMGINYELWDASGEERVRRALGAREPTLLEVRLGDSPGIQVSRARGLASAAARRAMTPGALRALKRALKRAP